jgi:hypothetical protein
MFLADPIIDACHPCSFVTCMVTAQSTTSFTNLWFLHCLTGVLKKSARNGGATSQTIIRECSELQSGTIIANIWLLQGRVYRRFCAKHLPRVLCASFANTLTRLQSAKLITMHKHHRKWDKHAFLPLASSPVVSWRCSQPTLQGGQSTATALPITSARGTGYASNPGIASWLSACTRRHPAGILTDGRSLRTGATSSPAIPVTRRRWHPWQM